jgi:hypothetical protein
MELLDKQVASTPALLGRSAKNHTKNRQSTGRQKKTRTKSDQTKTNGSQTLHTLNLT